MDVVGEMVVEYNLEKLCRLCLKEDDNVRSIFADENGQTFNEIIMTCAQIQILEDDGMPNQVCGICKVQAQTAYAFRKRIEENDVSLRAYMGEKFPEKFKETLLDIKSDQDFQNVEFSLSIEPDVSFEVDVDTGVQENEVVEYLQCDDEIKPDMKKMSRAKSNEQSSLECHLCGEEASDVIQLKGHIESSHTDHKSKQCRMCRSQFRLKAQPREIVEQEVEEEEEQENEKESCSQCDKKFKTQEGLKTHMSTHKKQKRRGRPSLKDLEIRNQLSNLKDPEEKQNKIFEMLQ